MKKIFVVPYCHPDWAWTHTRKWHEERYCLVFNEVLDIMKKNNDYKWYFDIYITQFEPFLRKHPERIKELRKRIKEGRIAICGTYSNLRTNMVGEETFIRDIILGKKLFKKFFPESDLSVYASTVDVATGFPQLPQILKKGEYKYLRVMRPLHALSAKGIPYEFKWAGVDGSEVICSRGSYGGLVFSEPYAYKEKFKKNWDEAKKRFYEREVKDVEQFSKTSILWLSNGSDDARPLRGAGTDEKLDLIEFFKEWNKREKIPIIWATPLDYFKEIEKEKLEKIEGTIDPCDVCYNTCFGGSSGLWFLRILCDRYLTEAEKAATIASCFSSLKYDEKELISLWENILLFSAHATQWLFEDDFNQLYNLALRTKHKIEEIKENAYLNLISKINYKENAVAFIFNPSQYSYRAFVKIFVPSVDGRLENEFSLTDSNGKEVEYQIINYMPEERNPWEVEVIAEVNLPANGYNFIYKYPAQKERQFFYLAEKKFLSGVKNLEEMENDKFKLGFEKGKLKKVKWEKEEYKCEGKNCFGNIKLFHMGSKGILFVDKFVKEEEVVWEKWSNTVRGDLKNVFTSEGKIGKHNVKMDTIIYKNTDRIDFEVEVDFYGEENALLSFSTPFNFFKGELNAGVPFSIEKKEIEKEVYGTLPFGDNIERLIDGFFYAKEFVDYSDGEKGISLITTNGDRYFMWDKKNKVLYHFMLKSINVPRHRWEKDINKTIEAKGKHKFSYSVYFHRGNWQEGKVYKQARILTSEPVVVERLPEKGKELPDYKSFIGVYPENVILTAFYEEGKNKIIRIYETEGKKTDCEISLPFKPEKAVETNFLGKEGEKKIKIKNNKLKFSLSQWEILTLKVS